MNNMQAVLNYRQALTTTLRRSAPVIPRDLTVRSAQQLTVAVLFSGGDAPGMNPLLKGIVRMGLNLFGARVLGIKDGYAGLLRAAARDLSCDTARTTAGEELQRYVGRAGIYRRGLDVVLLDHEAVSGLTSRGGACLGAARCPEFQEAWARRQAIDFLDHLAVDALIVVGGNGTLEGARRLSLDSHLSVIGIPATIDNDVCVSETALGVDTATNNVMRAIEQINDTANSHHRIMIVETMGRDCGSLARLAALAGGAEIVITPERGALTVAKMQGIAARLEAALVRGQTHAVIAIAEGVRVENSASAANTLCHFLERYFQCCSSAIAGIDVRTGVLGHQQRGGSPTASDRILATRFARAAWEGIMRSPAWSGIASVREGRVQLIPFQEAESPTHAADAAALYSLQKAVSKWV